MCPKRLIVGSNYAVHITCMHGQARNQRRFPRPTEPDSQHVLTMVLPHAKGVRHIGWTLSTFGTHLKLSHHVASGVSWRRMLIVSRAAPVHSHYQ